MSLQFLVSSIFDSSIVCTIQEWAMLDVKIMIGFGNMNRIPEAE